MIIEKKIRNLNELTDSEILLKKDVPPFGYILVLSVLSLIVTAVIWSISAHKSDVITAQVTVTTDKASYVMSSYTGQIENSRMKEGKVVIKGETLFSISSIEYDLQEEQLHATKDAYEDKVEMYQRLVKSIKDDENYFSSSDASEELYYSMYEAYKSQVAQLTFDGSAMKVYGYSDEQIENEVLKNQGKISELYYLAIEKAESEIENSKMQIASIDAQLLAIGTGQAEYVVKAPCDGVLHLVGNYKNGMVVQTGSIVASISEEESEIVLKGYVSTADMAKISEGDIVNLTIDGLAQSSYGKIDGKVITVDSNITAVDSGNGSSMNMFGVTISPNIDYLISNSGKKVNLQNGMSAEARIIYDELTYFEYFMEKIGLYFR